MGTKYVLKNVIMNLYFAGYDSTYPCNKPNWTEYIDKAIPYDLEPALRMKHRLFCQSQFVEMTMSVIG